MKKETLICSSCHVLKSLEIDREDDSNRKDAILKAGWNYSGELCPTCNIDVGYVYIFSNDTINFNNKPLYKIGMAKDPHVRAKDLTQSSAVASPFKIEHYVRVRNHKDVEKNIHRAINHYRHAPNREFFNCTLDQALELLHSFEKIYGVNAEKENTEIIPSEFLLYDTPVDACAEVYRMSEFQALCANEKLTDWDGIGHPVVSGLFNQNVFLLPSQCCNIPRGATHVIWRRAK